MFEITPDQAKVLEALLSPFGLILLVQAGKWLARQLGAEITVAHIRAFLAALSAGLAYAWLAPVLPPVPSCAEMQLCITELSAFAAALSALGAAWYGAAHFIYERLAKGLFQQLGWQ
jgi:hypothetical protein